MPEIKFPGDKPVVDFDDFWFNGNEDNRKIAKKLALILIDESDMDDLRCITDQSEKWDSSVGTGGGGWNAGAPSQGAQRALLASHFASYGDRKYRSCYLSLYEFVCLQELVKYLEEECSPAEYRQHIHDENVNILKETCSLFVKAYVKVDPSYLFTHLKNS